MASYRYKELSDTQLDIVGINEEVVATVEKGVDSLWRIVPVPNWVHDDELNFGPFRSAEEAFEELGAVQADQS